MPKTRTLAATLLISLLCATSQAEVRLPSIIGSHMVVQQGTKVPIWGWAEPGERVTVTASRHDDKIRIQVHNPEFIEPEIQLQIFQRSFSTKGKGRGIGTYSMKLFGERYLKGKVWFSSSEEEGTTFFVSIPLACGDR